MNTPIGDFQDSSLELHHCLLCNKWYHLEYLLIGSATLLFFVYTSLFCLHFSFLSTLLFCLHFSFLSTLLFFVYSSLFCQHLSFLFTLTVFSCALALSTFPLVYHYLLSYVSYVSFLILCFLFYSWYSLHPSIK